MKTSKLSQLPKPIRDQLNERLDDFQPAPIILEWLNNLDEVKALIQSKFNGHPFTDGNLSDWRMYGGFREWRNLRDTDTSARLITEDTAALSDSPSPADVAVADQLATVLMIDLIRMADTMRACKDDLQKWKLLKGLLGEISRIRREDYRRRKLDLEEQRLDLTRETRPVRSPAFTRKNPRCESKTPETAEAHGERQSNSLAPIGGEGRGEGAPARLPASATATTPTQSTLDPSDTPDTSDSSKSIPSAMSTSSTPLSSLKSFTSLPISENSCNSRPALENFSPENPAKSGQIRIPAPQNPDSIPGSQNTHEVSSSDHTSPPSPNSHSSTPSPCRPQPHRRPISPEERAHVAKILASLESSRANTNPEDRRRALREALAFAKHLQE